GEAAVEQLQGHLAAELEVLRAVHVGHAARPDPRDDLVALVDDGLGGQVAHQCSRASITCLAIGAATSPPVPLAHSLVTAVATFAIWSGVTARRSWPMPMRPTSIRGDSGLSRRPLRYSPLAVRWSAG